MPIEPTPPASQTLARYQDLLRASVDWLWETDQDHRIIFVSDSLCAATGLLPAQLRGLALAEVLQDTQRPGDAPDKAESRTKSATPDPHIATGTVGKSLADLLSERLPFRDHGVRFGPTLDQADDTVSQKPAPRWRLSGVPHYSSETGAFAGYRGTCTRDTGNGEQTGETNKLLLSLLEAALTRKDELERERQIAQGQDPEERLRAVAHELRTPLNAILGFSEIIRDWQFGDMKDRYKEYGGLIHDSGHHLLDLVNSLLHLAGAESADDDEAETFDPLEVAKFVHGLLVGQASRKGITLTSDLPEVLPRLPGARRALRQILLNLLANAVRHCNSDDEIQLKVTAGDGAMTFAVKDSGPGIAKKEQARIFQRNYQVPGRAALGGKGLGLAIAQELAEGLGGRITVDSRLGQGATFILTLPCPPMAEETPPPSPAPTPAPASEADNVHRLKQRRKSAPGKGGDKNGKSPPSAKKRT